MPRFTSLFLIGWLIPFMLACSTDSSQGQSEAPATKSKFELEDKVFACMQEVAKEQGHDLDRLIADFEDELMRDAILNNRFGKDYIAVLNQIRSEGRAVLSVKAATVRAIARALRYFHHEKCSPPEFPIDQTLYERSTVAVLDETLLSSDYDQPLVIAHQWLEKLPPEAFDHSFYKLVVMRNWLERDVFRIHDEVSENPDRLIIQLSKDGNIRVGDKETSMNDVSMQVHAFIRFEAKKRVAKFPVLGQREVPDYQITIEKQEGNSVQHRNELYQQVLEGIRGARSEFTYPEFGGPEGALNLAQMLDVKAMYPARIGEQVVK